MLTKAEKTKQFILEKISPYFNKHGYTGTSMADITKITGLTKGAIYGNFKDKEELALEAFNYNIRIGVGRIGDHINPNSDGITRLLEIIDFFKVYYISQRLHGGCPMQNVGVDSIHHNNTLHKRVVSVINKLIRQLADIIDLAKEEGTVKSTIDSMKYANKIYAQIQGGIFVSNMLDNYDHLTEIMKHVEYMIDNEMRV